jgi:SAM-dependent methyltransferase
VTSYSTFGLERSWRQLRHAWQSRRQAGEAMSILLDRVRRDEARMAECLGRPMRGLRMLEIGPGQGLERARYFGQHNEVVGIDLDVIPQGLEVGAYVHMLRSNGLGRVAKTVGRKLLVGRPNARAWGKAVGRADLPLPRLIHGDICAAPPAEASFDVVMSWSVFEHLPAPEAALTHVIQALRPGGLFFISLHLYTANNGHHDIRAFTGQEHELPLWAHLRPATQTTVKASAYLNKWRLPQWRELFAALAPGTREWLLEHDWRQDLSSALQGALRDELRDYGDDELLTVDAVYCWKKPMPAGMGS